MIVFASKPLWTRGLGLIQSYCILRIREWRVLELVEEATIVVPKNVWLEPASMRSGRRWDEEHEDERQIMKE